MDENLHTTEDLFYTNLDGHAEPPPPAAWDHISQTLDRDNLILIKKKYNRVKRFAALLLMLLIGFSVYEINSSHGYQAGGNDKTAQGPVAIPHSPGEKNTGNPEAGGVRAAEQISQSSTRGGFADTRAELNGVLPGDISVAAQPYVLFKNRLNNISAKTRVAIENPDAETDLFSAIENNPVDNNKKENVWVPVNDPVQELKPPVPAPVKPADLLRSIKPDSVQNITAANTPRKKNKKLHTFSIMPFFSPDIAWYRLQDDKPDNNIDDANELERTEKHEFSSTSGITAEYTLNDRWSLQSGLSFSNTNITMEPKVLYAAPDIDGTIKYRINTSSGYAYLQPSFNANPAAGDSLYSSSSLHSLQYIGIPLALVRRFSAGRFTVKAMAGISANILVHAKVETIVEKDRKSYAETIDQIRGLKKMYFGGLTGVALEYRVGKRTSLSFTPSLRFAINSINKENAVRSYPMSFGFNTGLKISF